MAINFAMNFEMLNHLLLGRGKVSNIIIFIDAQLVHVEDQPLSLVTKCECSLRCWRHKVSQLIWQVQQVVLVKEFFAVGNLLPLLIGCEVKHIVEVPVLRIVILVLFLQVPNVGGR